jgi:hypothetical protein
MKVKLQARHLWDAVEFPEIVEYDEDRAALDAICSAVPEEMVPALATRDTAHDAWEAIKTYRISDDRVRRATAQALRSEYEISSSAPTNGSRTSPCASPTSPSAWQPSAIRSPTTAWCPSTCAQHDHGTNNW